MMIRRSLVLMLYVSVIAGVAGFAPGGAPCACAQDTEPVEVSATVEPQTVAIGDTVRFSISITAPQDYQIELPGFEEDLGGFAIKDFGTEQKTRWGKQYIEKWFLLDSYVSGTYEIPEVVVTYTPAESDLSEEILTEPLEVIVESVLETTSGQTDIYDIKPPRSLPSRWGLILIVAGVLISICVAVILFFIMRKKSAGEPIIPPKPAHEIAYKALDALEAHDLISQGLIKEFFSELSLIVRHYVEDRFDIRAPEMTTEEFLESVKASDELRSEQKKVLREFLEQSDMVKFAKYGPAPEEIKMNFAAARRFIDETRSDNFSGGSDGRYEL